MKKTRDNTVMQIEKTVLDRSFHLSMIRKYSSSQGMVKKIISGVRKGEGQIKRLVKSYIEWSTFLNHGEPSLLQFSNAISGSM